MSNVANIPLVEIRENTVALRNVNLEGEEFLQLVDSIRTHGILTAISVRIAKDEETGQDYYCLVDGLHRFTAAKEAGIDTIPAVIVEADEFEQLEMQIAANLHKVATKPCEYAAQLKRMLSVHTTWTMGDLAKKLNTSTKWIKDRLSLNKIENERLRELIDSNDVPLANAYALAKLPAEEVEGFIEAAMTEPSDVFVGQIQERVSEIKEANRKGRDAAPPEFRPVPHARKMKELKDIIADDNVIQSYARDLGVDAEAFAVVVKWAMHLDESSVSVERAKFEEREAAKAERKRIREEEKAKKKAEKAREAAAEAEAAAAAVEA